MIWGENPPFKETPRSTSPSTKHFFRKRSATWFFLAASLAAKGSSFLQPKKSKNSYSETEGGYESPWFFEKMIVCLREMASLGIQIKLLQYFFTANIIFLRSKSISSHIDINQILVCNHLIINPYFPTQNGDDLNSRLELVAFIQSILRCQGLRRKVIATTRKPIKLLLRSYRYHGFSGRLMTFFFNLAI